MRYEGSPVKAPPSSRRTMMLPTPQPSSYPSIDETQWQTELEVQRSTCIAREPTVIARMESYLNKSDCLKLKIEGMGLLMGPEDSEVNLRYIKTNASRRISRISEIFSTKENSEHLVASKVRWDELQRQRVPQAQEERSQRNV